MRCRENYRGAITAGLLAVLLTLGGCQTTRFYHQALVGHSKLMLQRQSSVALREEGDIDPALHDRLDLVDEILAFAETLGLPTGDSYRTYVETGQSHVIWNVFATRPFDLTLRRSCFPVAGCVSYRGYFNKDDAWRYADYLQSRGWEVYVGGVTAYSTLGWFNDPLLDTFVFRDQENLAALIFHELAHQLVYVPGDTRFNESVATTIEQYAVGAWLLARGEPDRYDRYLQEANRQTAVVHLINDAREQLRAVYKADMVDEARAQAKQAVIETLVQRYRDLAADWGEPAVFQSWMNTPINNPKIETVADYNEWVPVLGDLLLRVGMSEFQAEIQRLSKLNKVERTTWLTASNSTSN